MSLPLFNLQDQLCYVQCGYCTTILLVSVSRSSMCTTMLTVSCGHCAAILSVNLMMRPSFLPRQFFSSLDHHQLVKQEGGGGEIRNIIANNPKALEEEDINNAFTIAQPPVTKPPEKRQRAPSAYNCFIKEEIKRLKSSNPKLSHKQAFSAASKNWAYLKPSQQHESDGGSNSEDEGYVQSRPTDN